MQVRIINKELEAVNSINALIKEEYGISERLHSEIIPAFVNAYYINMSRTRGSCGP
jgi:hypothetical protein